MSEATGMFQTARENVGEPARALERSVALFIGVTASVLALPAIWTYASPGSSATQLYHVAELLFWIFAGGVIFLPVRWSLFCLFLVMQVDVSVPGFVGTSSIGWENAVKALALPALVLWRVVPANSRKIVWTKSAYLWAAFMFYVVLATIWSPYKIAAAKMVGYLLCYLVLFWVLYWSWCRRLIDAKLVSLALWGSLTLGFLQTFVMGNPMNPEEKGRFTSFCWPQEFAPWLVSALAILMFWQGQIRFRKISIVCCIVAIVMTGSRFSFLGLACFLFVVWLRRAPKFTVISLAKSVSTTGVVLLVLCAGVLYATPTSRLRELLLFGTNEYQSVTDVGTFGSRLVTYQAVLSDVSSGGLPGLFFGVGTSTGTESVVKHNLVATIGFSHEDLVDPNRALNSDFVRVLYEWGIVGMSLGLILVVRLIGWAWRLAVRKRSAPGFALLGLVPTILLGLIVENVLAGAASPLGVGFLLVATWAFAEGRPQGRAPAGCNVSRQAIWLTKKSNSQRGS